MFYSHTKKRLSVIAAVALNSTVPIQAFADGDRPQASLEEIVVTARRAEEGLQSTPVSVTAFNNEGLRENSISTPEDLQVSTPGVFLSGTGSRQNVIYQIRGQSKSVFGPNSPAVASYFAEVPDPFVGSFVPQYDLDAVQVLKGPQGTLFGRNTTGGAILYSPQAPSHELNGYVTGILGNYDKQEIQGAITLPLLANKVALRIAGDVDQRDAYTKNIGNNSEIDNIDSKAFRVSLLVEPTENLSNTTIYDYYRSDSGGTAQVIEEVSSDSNLLTQLGLQTSALNQLARQKSLGPYKSNSMVDYGEERNRRSSLINRTEYQWNDIQLVNIFGYRTTELSMVVNTDGMGMLTSDGSGFLPEGLPVNYIKANLNDAVEQISNEFQVRGQLNDGKLDWLVGAFWLQSKPDGPQGSSVAFAQIPGMPLSGPAYNFIEEETTAVFGHFTYDMDDWLEGLVFEVGARYTDDKTESCTGTGVNTTPGPVLARSDVVEQGDCLDASSNLVNTSVNSASSDEFTWSVGFNWQITDDLFSYLVSRHGYRAGGVNGPTFSGRLNPYQSFAPETVTDVEWGLRSEWAIGGVDVRANLSAFIGRYDDVQSALTGVQTGAFCNPSSQDNPPGVSPDGDCNPSNDPAGGTLLVNVGKAEVSGVDLDFQVALTPNLLISLAGNYLDTKTRSYDLPAIFAPYVASQEINFDLTSEKSYTAGIRYVLNSVPFAEDVIFNMDYYWTDEISFSGAALSDYSLTNLRIDINSVMGRSIDFSLFSRNLFDEKYVVSGSSSGDFLGITAVVYGPPRMVGAELRYRF
jgi:iron complex outermembrane receptor protein